MLTTYALIGLLLLVAVLGAALAVAEQRRNTSPDTFILRDSDDA